MVAARAFGQHPAVWAGRPDLVGCHAWTLWALRLDHAEASAQHQARQRQIQAARGR